MRGEKIMDNLIRLSSMTEAMRAKNILQKHSIFSSVRKHSGSALGKGCTFGIAIQGSPERAYDILAKYGIFPLRSAFGDEE